MKSIPSKTVWLSRGFTLIELLVVVAIISILAGIALSNFLDAHTRAKIARVKSEFNTITTAVETYRLDYNAYPRVNPNEKSDRGGTLLLSICDNFLYYEVTDGEENDLGSGGGCPTSLTTPIAYISSRPPLDPFIGNMALRNTGTDRWTFNRFHCSYFFYDFSGAAKQRKKGWNEDYAPVESPARIRFNGPNGPVVEAVWALLSPGPDKSFVVKNPDGGDPWVSYQFLWSPQNWTGMMEGRHCLYDPTNGTNSQGDIWRTNAGQL